MMPLCTNIVPMVNALESNLQRKCFSFGDVFSFQICSLNSGNPGGGGISSF